MDVLLLLQLTFHYSLICYVVREILRTFLLLCWHVPYK